jgi:phosphatidate cytidylyltransferase
MALAVAEKGPSSLALRTFSALVMAPLAAGAILLGWPYFDILVAAGCAVLAWEWDRLCGGRFQLAGWLLLGVVLASVAVAGLGLEPQALLLACLGALLIQRVAEAQGGASPLWQAAGSLYFSVPAIALLWLRDAFGAPLVLWLFLAVWATDIAAFAAGRLIGGPHLAPRLSPNKTWAGLAGGMIGAAAVGALLARGTGADGVGVVAGLSALLAVVAQAGDLAESAVKRHFKVKDASGLIPGHGGLLDRVDGLLAAAPAVALLQLVTGGSVLAWR